jgi:hypothetical protein
MNPINSDIFGRLNWLTKKVKSLCCAIGLINQNAAQITIDNPPYVEFVWSDITEGWTKLSFANNDLNGNFTALITIGNVQRLYGGSNVGLTSNWVSARNAASFLISVDDPSGVITSVGDSTFFDFNALIFVNLPKAELGTFTFKNCSNLIYANLPATTQLGEQTFSFCNSINTININKCTFLGNLVFDNISGQTIAITLPAALATDPQIVGLSPANTVILNTV